MGLSGLTSMAPTGVITPATIPTEKDIVLPRDRLSRERQTAYVLIVGSGIASHWCSLWIFENGEVYSMELTAINEVTGSRWLQSRYKMRRLHSAEDGVSSTQLLASSSECGPHQLLEVEQSHGSRHGEPIISFEVFGCTAEFYPICSLPGSVAAATLEMPSNVPSFVQHVWPHVVQTFVESGGSRNYILTALIQIPDTSPYELRARAGQVPLNTAFYDMFFHNCQLFLIQLLCGKYNIEFEQLPLAVGSIAAGPLLLVLEVIFVALFHLLQYQQPPLAMLVGLGWVSMEIYLTWRYMCSYGDACGMLVGAVCTMLLWIVIAATDASDSSYARSIPVLSLIWDVCMVGEAMRANMVFHNGGLTLLNLVLVVMAVVWVTRLQLVNGWPVQDLLLPMIGVTYVTWNTVFLCFFIGVSPSRRGGLELVRAAEWEQRAFNHNRCRYILTAAACWIASVVLPVAFWWHTSYVLAVVSEPASLLAWWFCSGWLQNP
mmetsp:Transcript_22489/g.52994  ORF Transcript_22489/g.52994 Transcript_22489/m.52994 type:complete len:489 (-) Transcript_22489:241-1707(-)